MLWMGLAVGFFAPHAAAERGGLKPPKILKHGQLVTPWLSKDNGLLVQRRSLDARGFDSIIIESYSQTDSGWRVSHAPEPVLESERAWYREHGELEMYHRDIAAFIRAEEDRLSSQGWQRAVPVSVGWEAQPKRAGQAASTPKGQLVLYGIALQLGIERSSQMATLYLERPSNSNRIELAQIPIHLVELAKDRLVPVEFGRVARGWLVQRGQWFALQVDAAPTLHPQLRPGSYLVFTSMQRIADALELPRVTNE